MPPDWQMTLEQAGIDPSWLQQETVLVGKQNVRLWTVGSVDTLLMSLPSDSEIPYWAILWDSAIWLSRWLWAHAEWMRRKRVLELGCGVGLVSIVAQMSQAQQVVQNDYLLPALLLAQLNAQENGVPLPQTLQMDWRAWSHTDWYDWVLGADIVYDRALHAPLLEVLTRTLAPNGRAILVDPSRDSGWYFAEQLLQNGWHVALSLEPFTSSSCKEVLVMEVTLPPYHSRQCRSQRG